MRIVMIGGTGFLGYFITRELIHRGHHVVAIGLRSPALGSIPDGVEVLQLDVDKASIDDLSKVLAGSDVLIHGAGADGRFSSKAPALDAYRKSNVQPFHQLITTMKSAGTRRLVILGSYYTALQRLYPSLPIMTRSAYPISRLEQAEYALSQRGQDLEVAILELPYIFGAAPRRGTLWGYMMDTVLNAKGTISVASGGTACVTASQVGLATVGAVERNLTENFFPIGGENLSHMQIYMDFAKALGVERSFEILDYDSALQSANVQREKLLQAGIETGYDPIDLAYLQTQNLYLDSSSAMNALGYGPDNISNAIRETVLATQQFGGAGPGLQKMEN